MELATYLHHLLPDGNEFVVEIYIDPSQAHHFASAETGQRDEIVKEDEPVVLCRIQELAELLIRPDRDRLPIFYRHLYLECGVEGHQPAAHGRVERRPKRGVDAADGRGGELSTVSLRDLRDHLVDMCRRKISEPQMAKVGDEVKVDVLSVGLLGARPKCALTFEPLFEIVGHDDPMAGNVRPSSGGEYVTERGSGLSPAGEPSASNLTPLASRASPSVQDVFPRSATPVRLELALRPPGALSDMSLPDGSFLHDCFGGRQTSVKSGALGIRISRPSRSTGVGH